jgi:hypothetical protein
MLGVEPFAIGDMSRAECLPERVSVAGGPGLEQAELPLARTAVEIMAAALQAKLARRGEADRTVAAVELLLNDQMASAEGFESDDRSVFIAGLQARALEMRRARILRERVGRWCDGHRVTTQTM